VEARGMEIDQMRLFHRRRRFELATDGKWRDCLENWKRRTALTLLRDVVDSNLVVWELEFLFRRRKLPAVISNNYQQ
jgi:hypothetical protein